MVDWHFARSSLTQSKPCAGSCCCPVGILLCMQAAQIAYFCASTETCEQLDMTEAACMHASSNFKHGTPHGCHTALHLAKLNSLRPAKELKKLFCRLKPTIQGLQNNHTSAMARVLQCCEVKGSITGRCWRQSTNMDAHRSKHQAPMPLCKVDACNDQESIGFQHTPSTVC